MTTEGNEMAEEAKVDEPVDENFGVLHEDDQGRKGNLTAHDYEATYTEPGAVPGHEYPEGYIDTLAAQLEMKNG